MRDILIKIPDQHERQLSELAKQAKRSRASLVREAIEKYLVHHKREEQESAFGLWGEGEDGLAYQTRLRAEW